MSDDIVNALENVEQAVGRVEQAVKDKWSSAGAIWTVFIGLLVWSWIGNAWHSKWRYALAYDVDTDGVTVIAHAHDCEFLTAPLGDKHCHYDGPTVSTVRWATSTTGNSIISYDEGKTWAVFTPDASATVPKVATVKTVYISWEKKDD